MRITSFLFIVTLFISCSGSRVESSVPLTESLGDISRQFTNSVDSSYSWTALYDSTGNNICDSAGNYMLMINFPLPDSLIFPRIDMWIDSMVVYTKRPVGVHVLKLSDSRKPVDYAFKYPNKSWIMAPLK